MSRPTRRTAALAPLVRRALPWVLAVSALGFVARVVPVRDRCDDPELDGRRGSADAAALSSDLRAARLAVVREEGGGCALVRPSGNVRLAPEACAALRCEPGLSTVLASVQFAWLAPLLALYFAGTLAWAARWRALLALGGVRAPILRVWRVTLESQAGGILLPGGVGGDALRVAFGRTLADRGGASRQSPASLGTVIASVLLDRAIGLVTLAFAAAVVAWRFAEPARDTERDAATMALASIPIAFVGGLVALRRAHARRRPTVPPVLAARSAFVSRVSRVVDPVLEYVGAPGAPRAVVRAVAFSLVVSASQLAVVRGIVFALGASPTSEGLVYVGATMAFIVAVVPGLPGGWGTSDAAFVFFLARAGIAPSSALGVSLIYRLFWYGSGGVGALLFLFRGGGGGADPLERHVSDVPRHRPS